MRKKLLLILGLIFVGFLTVGLLLSRSTKSRVVGPNNQNRVVVPTPYIPKFINSQPLTYVADNRTGFPKELPVYKIVKHASLLEAEEYASSLGFSAPDKTVNNRLGTYVFYRNPSLSLIVSSSPAYLSYSVLDRNKDQLFSVAPENHIATDYINQTSLVKTPIVLDFKEIIYSKTEASEQNVVPQMASANLATFNYNFILDNVPLFIYNNPGTSSVSVDIDSKNQVVAFRTYLTPEVERTKQTSLIILYSEAVSRLTGGQGILVQMEKSPNEDDFIIVSGVPDNVRIINSELGYYYSPESDYLSNVYIFYGQGSKNGNTLLTTTVVSAVP